MAKYSLSVFVFRRDLRVFDNSGLSFALENSERVLPCFIFNPSQLEAHPYLSLPGLQFMLESLAELELELGSYGGRLYKLYGHSEQALEQLWQVQKFDALIFNRDYTPFSRERDQKATNWALEKGIKSHVCADALLLEPEDGLKPDGTAYTVFTPFYKKNSTRFVAPPKPVTATNYFGAGLSCEWTSDSEVLLPNPRETLHVHGGCRRGQAMLAQVLELSDYKARRDFPADFGTTNLSAHHKFGTVSVRQTYAAVRSAFGSAHDLIRELYWRDFFTHIGFNFPHVFTGCFQRKYDRLNWTNDRSKFEAWCSGRTGFPIVDAGLRQLVESGFMHNRVRMIVASFLTKDLHCDWSWGEKFFAQHLVDYDPCVNNGNWQWAASTGCDAQPYFRIFNPWLQQQKFDAEAVYIKRWIGQLKTVPHAAIHAWAAEARNWPIDYPPPLVDHAEAKLRATEMFEELNE